LNERVKLKLSLQPASAYLVQVYVEAIADEQGVDWKPKALLKANDMYKALVY
jgi:hypothetical protein